MALVSVFAERGTSLPHPEPGNPAKNPESEKQRRSSQSYNIYILLVLAGPLGSCLLSQKYYAAILNRVYYYLVATRLNYYSVR
jgi:hypothetical protein